MAVTAQKLLTELGNRSWSNFNINDMNFNNEDSAQARTELNAALRFLVNLQDFPFKVKEVSLTALKNLPSYIMREGQIFEIYNRDNLKKLEFLTDISELDLELTGEPVGFWIDYKNPEVFIRFYPVPDAKYNFSVVYNQFMPVRDEEGNLKFEFEKEDDFINLPSNLEYLFADCLILRTMITNNKDEQDENYRPMINEFEQAWRNFLRAARPVKTDFRVVW